MEEAVTPALIVELKDRGLERDPLGLAALALARRIDESDPETTTAAGLAALGKQFAMIMAKVRDAQPSRGTSQLDEIRKRAQRRRRSG